MTDKIVLNNVAGTYDVTLINDNFKKIAREFNDKVLYRQNPSGGINTVKNDLDMDSHHIFNLPAPNSANEAARLKDVTDAIAGLGGKTATTISFDPTTYIQATNVQGAIVRVMDKARENVSINDYNGDLRAAFAALGGIEETGFGTPAVQLDLLGLNITFTGGTLYVPINVSIINGTITSTSRLVLRNPHLANTALRSYTEYWPYMNSLFRGVKFACTVVINCYIGAHFDYCDFSTGGLVMVNSNSLWTEYNTFTHCFFVGNATVGAGILLDGNSSGTSTYSTGSGAGTSDGSFGYNSFIHCKGDTTAPTVLLKTTGGAVLYNGTVQFRGYARGAGGAFLYMENGAINQCYIDLHLESFGAASNIISIDATGRMWYCFGAINSASPQMTFTQNASADLRNNNISVSGAVLYDKNGSVVAFGDTVQSFIANHLQKRLEYISGSTLNVDSLAAGTQVSGPTVYGTSALESRVQYTGQITSRPNDTRSASSRNWGWRANNTAFGDYVLMESTTNSNDPATVRMQIQSGGACYNTTGTWGTLSDVRYKENISDARSYLDDLNKLRVVKYSLIEDHKAEADLLGLIAQEVEEVFPGLVTTSINPETGEDVKQVKTSVLVFMLLRAVQELSQKA